MNKHTVYFALLILTLSFGCNENDLLLKDYDPVSIYNIPKTTVEKAKFPAKSVPRKCKKNFKFIKKAIVLSSNW